MPSDRNYSVVAWYGFGNRVTSMLSNRLILFLTLFLSAPTASASLTSDFGISKCTFKGNTLEVSEGEFGTQNVSQFFEGDMQMNRLTNRSQFLGTAVLSPASVELRVIGEILNDRFRLQVQINDGNRILIRENRSALWSPSNRIKNYHAIFASPIVNEIRKYNRDMGSPSWSVRFPKNEMVMANLEISCLVGPASKQKSFWPWPTN